MAGPLFALAYRVEMRRLPEAQSAVKFTRDQLDRLSIGIKIMYVLWETK